MTPPLWAPSLERLIEVRQQGGFGMIKVIFRRLKHSEFIENSVRERVGKLEQKFPDLERSQITVFLDMENSPSQPGPDLFHVRLEIRGGRMGNILMTKSSDNIYVALADVLEAILVKLNRVIDRRRAKMRAQLRREISAS